MPEPLKLDIVKVDEPWATAYLADGTQVRAKIVFSKAGRLVDDKGQPGFADDGQPAISIRWSVVTIVEAPEKLRHPVKT